MPAGEATLQTIYSYYLSTVKVNAEGDASLDELNLQGLGMAGRNFLSVAMLDSTVGLSDLDSALRGLADVIVVSYGSSLSGPSFFKTVPCL